MTQSTNEVARHYSDGELLNRILAGLTAAGADLDDLSPQALAPVEEFHIGGRDATVQALEKMAIEAHHQVLDIGCGIGGAARYIAMETGCSVTGIDLTPEYIEVAEKLTDMTRLQAHLDFLVSDALDMPFDDAVFDAAITLHVAMNIHDRASLYAEIARVLRPGATFYVFDVMKKGDAELQFPVPWAATAATSHLTAPNEMCELLETAGFEVQEIADRTDFALDFFARQRAAAADGGPPPLGVHVVMGDSAGTKLGNVLANIERGAISPVQMVAVRK